MSKDGEIRQTVRVSENRHPDEFAYLMSLKTDGVSWSQVLLGCVQKAMKFDMGDPQLVRIEKQLQELATVIKSQPVTAVKVLEEIPQEEKVPAVNPFGKGFDTW